MKNIGFTIVSIVVFAMAASNLAAKDKVIDRSRDHLDTIKYVGQEYIKSAFPRKAINFESPAKRALTP